MISIPFDSFGAVMAKPSAVPSRWSEWLGPAVVIAVILFLANYFSGQLDIVRNSLGTISGKIDSHAELIGRLDERMKSLDDRTKLLEAITLAPHKSKAVSAGFINPEIVLTSLDEKTRFESKTFVAKRGPYFIQYTVLSYNLSTKILRLDMAAQLPGVVARNNTIEMRVAPGQYAKIPNMFNVEGMPVLFLQVLELPSPNQAILAIGPKVDSTNKTS